MCYRKANRAASIASNSSISKFEIFKNIIWIIGSLNSIIIQLNFRKFIWLPRLFNCIKVN